MKLSRYGVLLTGLFAVNALTGCVTTGEGYQSKFEHTGTHSHNPGKFWDCNHRASFARASNWGSGRQFVSIGYKGLLKIQNGGTAYAAGHTPADLGARVNANDFAPGAVEAGLRGLEVKRAESPGICGPFK